MTASTWEHGLAWAGSSRQQAGYVATAPLRQMPVTGYPTRYLNAGIKGAVMLVLYVSEDGRVADAAAVCATDDGFISSALLTVRRNVYRPATLAGRPVRDIAFQPIVFSF